MQEEIEAKRETHGNYNAMMVLLDNLQRRENWPDQFISALRTCEQSALANKINEEYDKIRGIHSKLIFIINAQQRIFNPLLTNKTEDLKITNKKIY